MSLHRDLAHEDHHRTLSGAQSGLWYAGRLATDSAVYNTAEAVEIKGTVDAGLFETALRRTVAEADTFALRFSDTDEGPRCRTAPDPDAWTLHRVEITGADPDAAAQEYLRAELAKPADLEQGTLFSHTLLTLAPDRHIWLLRAHHILLDGYSYKLLGRRLADVYNALAAGREPAPATFEPVSRLREEEAAYLASERCARDRDEWTQRLAGLPEPARLTRRNAPPAAPFLRRTAELGSTGTAALSAAAARLDVTRADLLTAAFAVYLHRMTGVEDLVLGMAVMGRSGSAALRTPGTTSDVLPLRVAADPTAPFAELVAEVAGELRALRRRQRYRGESIRRDLNLLGTGRRLYGPVLNIVPFTESLEFGGHPATWHHLCGGAVDDLQISVRPGTEEGGLWLAFDANPALYDEDELTLHRDRFVALLRRLTGIAPATPLADLDLLLPGEHPDDTSVRDDLPVTVTLPELFERQARSVPGRTAVTCEDQHLTYAELDAEANRLAHLLIERGAGPGRVVALRLNRGLRLLPALLAVLKTGAAYLPLDPGHPAERLRLVMDDAAPVLLVTETALAGSLTGAVPAVVLDDPAIRADLGRRPDGAPADGDRPAPVSPTGTAYIIYTSGSTGRPKGVSVTHANVIALFTAARQHFDFGPDDVWTLFHSYAFDFSVWEMWGALLHGGRLVVVPHAVSRSSRDFLRLLHHEGVTVLSQTPSAFDQLVDADAELPAPADGPEPAGSLRYVVFGGETLRPPQLLPWARRHGLDSPALVNMYGVTEATVVTTHHRVTWSDLSDPRRNGVIGTPMAGLRVYLLDPAGRPVPPGAVGEIHVAGAGVSGGYLNRPELTAERFLDDPYGPPGSRMYRSGDLAWHRADGTLAYLHRADQQVQLRGFRVEPGEIEAVLSSHPGILRTAVVVRRTADDGQQLIAYTIAAGPQPPTPAELRAYAATRLPDYMVPAACVPVDALPLNPNGKLDTKALPEPDFVAAAAGNRPRSARQAWACALFEDVLRLPRHTVGTDADFFDLGGDSLLVTRLLARVQHELGTEVPIAAFFDGPTPEGLAQQCADRPGNLPARPPLRPMDRPQQIPLSFGQERMWFLHRLDDSAATYNIPLVVPVGQGVDADVLAAALGDLADRHESLRTVFADQDGSSRQRVLPPGRSRPALRVLDCPADEIGAHVRAACRHQFDLTAESPLAAWLLGGGEARTLLLLLHHSAADGWSLRPLAEDLSTAYAARAAGGPPAWAPLPVQYADYALWQRALFDPAADDGTGWTTRLTRYWRETLTGLPEECTVPGDRPRPAVPSGAGAHVDVAVDTAFHHDLLGLAEREGASLFMVLHAAVSALLTRCGAGEDIVVGTPVAGRSEPALDDVIGLVTNTLVLRADTSGDPAFRDLLAQVRRHDLAALDHQDLPFDRLVDELNPARRPGRHPLFQVMLALQNNEPAMLRLAGETLPLRPTATGTAKFDLFVDVLERHGPDGTPDGIDLHIEYDTDLYDAATADEFGHALTALLRAVCEDPGRRLGDLPAPPARLPSTAPGTPAVPLEEAALSVPGIRDAAALPGPDGGAPRLYVVPGRADAAEHVERALAGTGRGAVRVTAVNSLPRTADGALDTAALLALPPADRATAETWRQRLAAVPGVSGVETGVEAAPHELGRRQADPPRRTVPQPPADRQDARPAAPPALSEGPEPAEPAVPGWAQALVRAAERDRGDITHVHADGGETRRDYASLAAEASRVLTSLRRAGLRPGDQVILQCDDSEDFLAVLWGCVLGGFVAVPLTVPASYTTASAALAKLEGIWRMLGRPWMVCSPALEADLRELAAREEWPGLRLATAAALRDAPEDRDWYPARPDDLLLMLMTSGSTGLPKAVRLTHGNVLTRSAAAAAMNGLGERDVSLNWIPLDHVTGVVMFHLRDVYLGCRQVHAPTSWILQDPVRWMDLAHRHRVSVTWAPNFAFGLLAGHADRFPGRGWDLSPMRLVMNAGEVVVAATARRFLHTLRPYGLPQDVMHPGWGMSETCSVVTDRVLPSDPPDTGPDETFVSCGLPYPGFAMRIAGESDGVLAEGEVGRLQVRGTSVTGGYHDNPQANAEAFTDDGWFDTGDLAFLRDGELYITGRAKDVIIVNGVNHYSHEIEACVEQLPSVVRSFTAAVAVRADPAADTDQLALFVHLRDGHDPATALREISGTVTRETGVSPAFVIPVDAEAVPKTEIGKIQRTKLRKSFEAGAFDDAVRAAQLLLGTGNLLPDWFLRPVWRRAGRHRPRPASSGRHVLVLAGGDERAHELSGRLARTLRAEGALCTEVTDGPAYARQDAARYRIRPHSPTDHTALLRSLERDDRPVDVIVHLGALHPARPAVGPEDAATGTTPLLALARSLAGQPRPARLLYVTAGAHAVAAGDTPTPAHAMAGALLKSLAAELGTLSCVHLDLDPRGHQDPVPLLLDEMTGAPADNEVAHREGHRHVRRLERLPESVAAAPAPATDGFHLLSGGLGGVGAELAAHLLRTPGTRLLVLGRTPLPAEETWPRHLADGGTLATRIRAYRRLRDLGEVRYATADVTDEEQVTEAVRAAAEHWGSPLVSVLHLAGALVERPLGELDPDTWEQALSAKVRGAWTLHRVSAGHPVHSFVTFSSVNGWFGAAVNSAYAAANAYLDALVLRRRALGLPGQSLAWSMWREHGMSTGYRLAPLTEARGYRILDTQAALRSFDFARALDAPHLLIGADPGAPWVRSHVSEPVRQVRRLTGRVALEEDADLGALYRAAAEAAGDDPWVLRAAGDSARPTPPGGQEERLRDLESRIAAVWRDLLNRERIGRDENFFDLGGNSLLLITAQSTVKREFGHDLPVVDLFAHPTVRGLARHLSALTAPPSADAPPDAGPQLSPGPAPDGDLTRATERAQRQRAARARRSAQRDKDRKNA
ncbi:amino acid adenylation domain-containing protein [Streptomyces humi]